MKHLLILVMVIGNSLACFAHVEKTYYLKGKIGKRDIAIKMLCYDELPTRYIYFFFLDDKKDHLLTGHLKDKFWSFMPEVQQGKQVAKPAVTLNIAEADNDTWKGNWTDSTGKANELVLTSLLQDSIHSEFSDLPFVKELDPYESYRLSNIHFIKTKTEKPLNDLFCDWNVEEQSGISFFRLRSVKKELNTDSINAELETINLSLIQKYFQYMPEKTGLKVETSLLYEANQLISFRILSTFIFSTGKTSQAKEFFTLDIKSGQPVNLEDLVWFDKAATKPPMADLYKIYIYRKRVFAPKIFSLLQELYPGKMNSDSCGINKVDTWTLPVWNLTRKGIAFSFRTADQCGVEDWAVIPYQKLQPFMEEKYHLKMKR